MTISDTSRIVPQWRLVHSMVLGRAVQVRRITVGDVGKPTHELWLRLVRDGDGSPLLPACVSGADCDPTLVEEVCQLAMADPIEAGEQPA